MVNSNRCFLVLGSLQGFYHAGQHAADLVAIEAQSIEVFRWHDPQVLRKQKKGVNFGSRTPRDVAKLNVFFCRSSRCSLGQVGGDRNRCPPQLGG